MRCGALLLVALLATPLYSCRQRSSNVETPSAHNDSGTPDATPFAAAVEGDFQCTMQIAKRSLSVTSCHIDASGELSIIGPNLKVQGNTKQTAFGLAFQGSITLGANHEAANLELFQQGAGNLAAVFVLADGQFAKMNLVPSTH